jgi:heme exporter protein CcmD
VNVTEFLSMGGYGFYVWGSYLVTALALVIEVRLVIGRRRRAIAQLIEDNKLALEIAENDESTS